MKTKTIAAFISVCLFTVAVISLAASKNQVSVVPLASGDAELTAQASAELINAFSSLDTITVKEISPKLQYKAEMTYSYGSNKFPSADKEKIYPLRFGALLDQTFTPDKFALSGLQLRVSAYGAIPESPYMLYIKDSATETVIREAIVPVFVQDGVHEITVIFEPIINSKNNSYIFTIAPAKIERDKIIGVSVTPTEVPDKESKEPNAKKTLNNINFNPVYADFAISETEKGKSKSMSYLSSADNMVFSSVSVNGNTSTIQLKVYSRDINAIVFAAEDSFTNKDDLKSKTLELAKQIDAALSNKMPESVLIEPSLGTSDQSIFLTWKPFIENYNARIYRSTSISGPFMPIGTSNSSSFIDRDAEAGKLYWYKVQLFNEQIVGNLSQASPGYKKITVPGITSQKLMAAKNLNIPAEKTAATQKEAQQELAFLKEKYMNSVKLSVMLSLGKSYIDSGAVTVFENINEYSLDLRKREVYLLKDNALIKFYGKRLFNIRESIMPLNNVIATAEFGAAGNSDNFAAIGFTSPPQQDLRWNDTSAPSLEFTVDKPTSDLFVDMHLAPPWVEEPYTCKKVEVFANDTSVGSITVTGKGRYRVMVPANLVTDNKLKLNFYVTGTVGVDKKIPHARIAFYSVSISKKIMQDDFFARLMKNGVFYCVYEKDVLMTQADGTMKYIPMYSAVGMSTEYYKNNKNWRGSTVAITSSDEVLIDRVKKMKK